MYRVLVMTLSGAMLLGLAACGDNTGSSGGSADTSGSAAPSTTAPSTTAPSTTTPNTTAPAGGGTGAQ